MIKLTNKELYEWRQRGATYQEMADAEGTTRQDVFQKVKAYERKLMGKRGRINGFNINKIVYKGIYEYFRDHIDETVCSFSNKVFGYAEKVQCVKRFLLGESESLFKVHQIKKMMEVTGKSFDELFELREMYRNETL